MTLGTVKLKKGDTLIITLRSDDIDEKTIKNIKKQFKKQFKNNKVAIFGIGQNDEISISAINK